MEFKKYVFVFVLIGLMLAACDSFRIEKRRYMKGFYVSTGKSTSLPKKKATLAVAQYTDNSSDSLARMPIDPIAGIVKKTEVKTVGFSQKKSRKHSGASVSSKVSWNRSFYDSPVQAQGFSQDTNSNRSKRANYFLIGLSAFCGLSFFSFIKFKKEKALKMSRWASKHLTATVALMAAFQLLIGLGGHFLGGLLHDLDFSIAETTRNIMAGGFITALLLYPVQKINRFAFSSKGYFRQKVYEFALLLFGTLLAICSGNTAAQKYKANLAEDAHHSTLAQKVSSSFESAFHFNTNLSPEEDETLRTILTILTMILLVVLQIAVVAFACYFTCANQVGLAAVLLIGGTALLVVAAIFTFKALKTMGEEPEPAGSA